MPLAKTLALGFAILTMAAAVRAKPPAEPRWHFYKGHWYARTLTSGRRADVAAEAAAWGAALVTIDDAGENDWLVETFGTEWFWIGLSQTNGRWHWPGGTAPAFQTWAPGQPDNRCGADRWAMINVEGDIGRWHDVPAEGWPRRSPGNRGLMELTPATPTDDDVPADLDVWIPLAAGDAGVPHLAAVPGFVIESLTLHPESRKARLRAVVRFTSRTATAATLRVQMYDDAGRFLGLARRSECVDPKTNADENTGTQALRRRQDPRILWFDLPSRAWDAERVRVRVRLTDNPPLWDLGQLGRLDPTNMAYTIDGDGIVEVDLSDDGTSLCPTGLGHLASGKPAVKTIRLNFTCPTAGDYRLRIRWTAGGSGSEQFVVALGDQRLGASRLVNGAEHPYMPVKDTFALHVPQGRNTLILHYLSGDGLHFKHLALTRQQVSNLQRFTSPCHPAADQPAHRACGGRSCPCRVRHGRSERHRGRGSGERR